MIISAAKTNKNFTFSISLKSLSDMSPFEMSPTEMFLLDVSSREMLSSEASLLDVSLFEVSPFGLKNKRHRYNWGKKTFQRLRLTILFIFQKDKIEKNVLEIRIRIDKKLNVKHWEFMIFKEKWRRNSNNQICFFYSDFFNHV